MTTKEITTQDITLATKLYDVQAKLVDLKDEESALREALFDTLKRQHVKSVRLEDGTSFTIAEKQTLKVKDMEKALKWAEDKNVIKLDTGAALKIVRRNLKLPKFFEVTKTEYLTVRKPGVSDDE